LWSWSWWHRDTREPWGADGYPTPAGAKKRGINGVVHCYRLVTLFVFLEEESDGATVGQMKELRRISGEFPIGFAKMDVAELQQVSSFVRHRQ